MTTLLLIPTTVVLARLLSPTDFGIAAAASFFLQLASRLTQFGFGASLVRLKQLRPEHVSSVFVVSLVLGITGWGALIAVAPAVGRFLRSPETAMVLPVAGFGFVLMAAGVVPTALLTRDMRYRESSTSEWIGVGANAAVAIALAWRGSGFWSLVYGHLAGDAARTAARMWMARWRPTLTWSPTAMREMLSFGAGVYVRNMLDYGAQNLDNLIVGRLLGMTELGFYDKAFSLTSRLIARINLAGPSVTFRIFSLIHEERERFRRAYRKVVLAVTIVGYPLLTGMIVAAPHLIEVLFGPRWLPSVPPFRLLCAAGMLKLVNTYASTATQATGRIWSDVRRHACFTVLLVALVVIMCRWGIAGAAAGVLLANVASTVMLHALVRRLTGLTWRDMCGPQVPGVLCASGLAVILLLTRTLLQAWFGTPAPVLVLTALVAVGAVYFVAFVALSRFADVRDVVHETLHDLAPALAKRITWLRPAKETPALVGR